LSPGYPQSDAPNGKTIAIDRSARASFYPLGFGRPCGGSPTAAARAVVPLIQQSGTQKTVVGLPPRGARIRDRRVNRRQVVRPADQGMLPSVKVGSHRRLRASDVVAYKTGRDAKRGTALDRLAALSDDAGGYQLGD
jgi:excisionase family DNA binding protein